MLDMVMAILHSNSEVMNAQPKGVVHVFTDDELRTAGEEILLLIQQLNIDGKPQLKQCNVSGRSEQLPQPKDQLITNSSIQQLLAKIHDDIEGRYNLDVADLQDVEAVLAACQ